MDPREENQLILTRRQLLRGAVGAAALGSLLNPELFAAEAADGTLQSFGALDQLHHRPAAKRVIYLFQSGGPSHIDIFDHKPKLRDHHGEELPSSIRMGQRITGMTSGQSSFPCVAPMFEWAQHGQAGIWLSELVPGIAGIADDICVIRSMHTEAINHDPAITYIQTGSQQPGRPANGAWLSYGIGSENHDLPAYIVLISRGSSKRDAQPLFSRLWGPGFLPSGHQGVKFRSQGEPVLYLSNPDGISDAMRRRMLDSVNALNQEAAAELGDPEIQTRIEQYEMAYRMQTSVPGLLDLSDEPESTFELYGEEARKPGSYAANCLLARRLSERGVRFVQLFHRGWDQHFNLPSDIRLMCGDTDRASAALVTDLKQRGLLDETLVVWGGEFGRTVYSQGALTMDNYGRDHHGRCFSLWMAGGGIKAGHVHGETDDYCYNIVRDPVHIHDLNATILHCLGIDHERLTFQYQGRNHRLTDIAGRVVQEVLA